MCGGGHPPVRLVSHQVFGLGERPDPCLPKQAAGIQQMPTQSRMEWVSTQECLLLILLNQENQSVPLHLTVFRWTWSRRRDASKTPSSQECWSAGSLGLLAILPTSAPLSASQAPRFYLAESLGAVCLFGWNRKAQRYSIFGPPEV